MTLVLLLVYCKHFNVLLLFEKRRKIYWQLFHMEQC